MRRSSRRGVGALEFAFTLPILLLVMLGIVEMSLLMHRMHVVTRAARDGCRTGAGVFEGPNPTGDLISAAAVEQSLLSLQAAGVDCNAVTCDVDTLWFERDGWWLLRVDVGVSYAPLTGWLDLVPQMTRSDFVMLTRQQPPPVVE